MYGFNYGMIPIISYNYGSQKYKRVKDSIKLFLKINITVTFIGEIIFLLFTKNIISIYTVSAELLNIAIPALKILSFGFVFAGVSLVISAIFQSFRKWIL